MTTQTKLSVFGVSVVTNSLLLRRYSSRLRPESAPSR